jgi:hypothetical protein
MFNRKGPGNPAIAHADGQPRENVYRGLGSIGSSGESSHCFGLIQTDRRTIMTYEKFSAANAAMPLIDHAQLPTGAKVLKALPLNKRRGL